MKLTEEQIQTHLLSEYPDYQTAIAPFAILEENKNAFELFEAVCSEWDYHPNGQLARLNKGSIQAIIVGLGLSISPAEYQQLLNIERVIKNHVSSNRSSKLQ